MRVYQWRDQRLPNVPRGMMQRGQCDAGHCGQYSVSISDGDVGLTLRFDSEEEFRSFLERGEIRACGESD